MHLQPPPMSSPHSHRMSASASPQPTSSASSTGPCVSGVAHTLTGSTTIQAVSHESTLANLAKQQQTAIAAIQAPPPPPPYKSNDYYRSGGHHSPAPLGGASPASIASAASASSSLSSSSSSSVLDSTSATNKELLALHNGAWTGQNAQPPPPMQQQHSHQQQQQQMLLSGCASPGPSAGMLSIGGTVPIITMPSDSPNNQQLPAAGQEKIIRAFGELMRNMARMKQYIRPSMCKPYGKQSEGLQKSECLRFIRVWFLFHGINMSTCPLQRWAIPFSWCSRCARACRHRTSQSARGRRRTVMASEIVGEWADELTKCKKERENEYRLHFCWAGIPSNLSRWTSHIHNKNRCFAQSYINVFSGWQPVIGVDSLFFSDLFIFCSVPIWVPLWFSVVRC